MLGGFRLQLGSRPHEGHQGEVDIDAVVTPDVLLDLAHGFQKGEALDVTHRAPHLHDGHVGVVPNPSDGGLDLVCDVRDHLDSPAEVVPAAFLLDHGEVDLARGDVVVPRDTGEVKRS